MHVLQESGVIDITLICTIITHLFTRSSHRHDVGVAYERMRDSGSGHTRHSRVCAHDGPLRCHHETLHIRGTSTTILIISAFVCITAVSDTSALIIIPSVYAVTVGFVSKPSCHAKPSVQLCDRVQGSCIVVFVHERKHTRHKLSVLA